MPDAKGVSHREVLQGLIERSRNPAKREAYEADLLLPPFPKALAYLWSVFWRLSRRRASTGMGVSSLSWGDIDAFVRNAGFPLAPWEIEVIEDLDNLFVAASESVKH